MTLKNFVRAFAVTMTLFLTACFIPEDFKASVSINDDGNYQATYDGLLVFAPALQVVHQGELTKEDEDALAEVALELEEEPGFESVKYVGRGRYAVMFEWNGEKGTSLYFPGDLFWIMAIKFDDNGDIRISSISPDDDDKQQLEAVGVKVSGEFSVDIERGVDVIEHNADSTPWFDLFGKFTWNIGSTDDEPSMHLRLAQGK